MRRTLLVTNDFPPRAGGIQSYLHTFAMQLPPEQLVVYAPRWRGDSHVRFDAEQPFEVVRHPTTLMLPTPLVLRRARKIMRSRGCETVWFGAAAPLALLGPALRRAGAQRIVATTHGHEVGWSMLPGARQALRRIGDSADAITYVSRYTRGRFAAAFGALGHNAVHACTDVPTSMLVTALTRLEHGISMLELPSSAAPRPSYELAQQLAREGADVSQLVERCGLSPDEASLIVQMHAGVS